MRWQIRELRRECTLWNAPFNEAWALRTGRECDEYAAADHIVVGSRFVKETFISEGVPPEKVHVIPYGANVARFHPVGTPAEDEFVVLFVGEFGLRKGAPYLLQAFAKLRHPRKTLKIVGAVSPQMRAMLCRFDLSEVEFLGRVPNEELAAHYSAAHLFVLPSIEEGLALVMSEALACGTPVLASSNTGAADLFTDGVEGFIVPPRDAGALAERMTRFMDDPALRATMRQAALARAASIGGWDGYGDAYAKLIRNTASR
jgi:glycosyltransferase involved in cell wall biosynthesis